MKKYFNLAIKYAIAALIWGVFYREFTKWNGFTGVSVLGKVHGHMLLLGTIVFLIVALYVDRFPLEKEKMFSIFMITYNIGVPLTALMMVIRGIVEVLGMNVSTAINASISGIAGIGHMLTGIGIICLLFSLKKVINKSESN